MELNRRDFLSAATGVLAAVGARGVSAAPAEGERPLLRIGVLSDSQGCPYPEDWGFHNFERALEGLAKRGVDVLVNAGDIMDLPEYAASFGYVQELERKWFGDAKPVDVACLGNHELGFFDYAKEPTRAAENVRSFCEAYGYPPGQLVHRVVKGFDFIAYSCYEDRGYDAKAIAELKAALDGAVARDAKRPIFVVTHFHPKDTVIDSAGRRGAPLRELFDRYPQVVSLSGHCHCPLQDERCIWQGAFTALETSTLSYGCMPVEYENECSCLIPWGRESVGYMTMDVYDGRIEVRRWQAEDQKEMKPHLPWRIDWPYDPAKARYTEEIRKRAEVAPFFVQGTPYLLRYDYGYVYIVFDQAKHPDMVHHYRLALTEIDAAGKATGPTKSWRYLGNFYRYERNRDRRQILKIPPNAMAPGRRYRIETFPVANFGTEGLPLAMERTIRPGYGFRNDPVSVAYPQE